MSGTALSATVQRHQLVVKGIAGDTLVPNAGNGVWDSSGTVSNRGVNYTAYQNDASNSQVLVQNGVTVTNNDATGLAGNAFIDLATFGKLMSPVQNEGKRYYFWDISGDGNAGASGGSLNNGVDYVGCHYLDRYFKYDVNDNLNTGRGTNDTNRFATLNEVKVALQIVGASGIGNHLSDTAYSKGSTTTLALDDVFNSNATYDDLGIMSKTQVESHT